MRIERVDDRLKHLKKPQLCELFTKKLTNDDVLILCAGFEDRATEIVKRLKNDNNNVNFKVIILRYLPENEYNKFTEINELFNSGVITPTCITFDREDPSGIGSQILGIIKEIKGRIYIDISAMSRILIVQLLVAIGNSSRGFRNSEVLYSEALKYPPSQQKVEEAIKKEGNDNLYQTMFLSTGVMGVTIVPELSSVALQGQPIRLIVFPSFNSAQLSALIGELQPFYLNMIHGIPSLKENQWRPDVIKKINHTDTITDLVLNSENFSASTLDYRETLEYLLEIYQNNSVLNRIVLAPTGSKMQSVAVGVFRAFMTDIQIVYPTPISFDAPSEYTEGVRNTYSLPLDDFENVLAGFK
jgi:hypothetical protein